MGALLQSALGGVTRPWATTMIVATSAVQCLCWCVRGVSLV